MDLWDERAREQWERMVSFLYFWWPNTVATAAFSVYKSVQSI